MNLEEELLKTMSKEELRGELGRVVAEFHGFITKNAALKVIAAERGVLKKEITKISDVTVGSKSINLSCAVRHIGPLKKYPTGNRSRIVAVEDSTGTAELLLWNEDAEEAAGMKAGDSVDINNAYEKNGKLSLGYSGYLKITKKAPFSKLSEIRELEGKRTHIRSFIAAIKGTEKNGFCFVISDGENEAECFLAAKQDAAQRLKEKKEIVIENALIKNSRIIIDADSRLLAKRENVAVGKVERMEPAGDGMLLVIGGTEVMLGRNAAFRLLGIKEVPGVELTTIINLKKNMFIGRNIVVELEGGKNDDNAKGG